MWLSGGLSGVGGLIAYAERAAGVEIHLGRFFLMSAVLSVRSGSTVPLCPRVCLCIQVQLCMSDSLKAALALKDQLVKNTFSCIQIRVPDSVGVKQVELVRLGHLPGELLKLVEELQIRRRELLLLATRVVFGGGISSAGGHSNGYRPPVSSRTLLCSTAFDPPRRRAKNLAKPSASAKIFCRSNSVVRRKWSVRMSAESSG